MDPQEAIATLTEWLDDSCLAGLDDVRQLLLALGYEESPATDFRTVILYYKQGWQRWTFMANEPSIPLEYRKRIARWLIDRLTKDLEESK